MLRRRGSPFGQETAAINVIVRRVSELKNTKNEDLTPSLHNAPIRERVRASIALLDRSGYATSDPGQEPPRRSELDDFINS